MALKRKKKYEFIEENQRNKEGVTISMNKFNNVITEEDTVSSDEVTSEVESDLEEAVKDIGSESVAHSSFNNNQDSKDDDGFFKAERIQKVSGIFTQNNSSTDKQLGNIVSQDDLEIDMKPKMAVEEGRYKFQVINVSVEKDVPNDYGVKDKITIEFKLYSVGEAGVVEYTLNQRYNISTHYKSFFFEAYKALTGKEPFGKINVRKLLGIVGDCAVKHIEMGDKNLFAKIVNISTEK
jgi:hypothetical protein